jgi:hypothetical protein
MVNGAQRGNITPTFLGLWLKNYPRCADDEHS